jgi:MoxR-like ATPase
MRITTPTVDLSASEAEWVGRLEKAREQMLGQMHKVIVGQDEVLEQLVYAVLCRGHCLLEGVPGLAKTVMVQTLGAALNLTFRRIQFTPDLMPSDMTGRRQLEFIAGPIFTNLLLADEINRTPPKTQAALLEAMQERRTTCRGRTYDLPNPFFVLATQNPIEQEGTYNLPEAQLDRFMFMVKITYPTRQDEIEILKRTTGDHTPEVQALFSADEILQLQKAVRRVPIPDHVYDYVVNLVNSTRPGICDVADATKWLQWGAGPRAGQQLILGGKARALLHGRYHVTTEDIATLAKPVMRHRIICNFAAQAGGLNTDIIIDRLVEHLNQTTRAA